MSNIRARIARLEKANTVRKPMTWRQLVECDDVDQLPADQREAWRAFLEKADREKKAFSAARKGSYEKSKFYLRRIKP